MIRPRWRLLIPILLLALLMRVGYMPGLGHPADINLFAAWTRRIYDGGLLTLYHDNESNYPPGYMAALGLIGAVEGPRGSSFDVNTDVELVTLIKVFPVLADLLMILAVYVWLRDDPPWRWLIPALMAISPGMIIISAWWGQNDPPLTLLIILAALALNRDRPLIAWVCFALAMLIKLQAVILLPLLLVLTYRRFGWRRLALGLLIAALIAIVTLAPFVVESGLTQTLAPYLTSVDHFPVLTVNAYNPWILVTQIKQFWFYGDSIPQIGPITFKELGLVAFAAYTLLICVTVYRQSHERREFVWATGLFFGFFMLSTQMHERYLYMGAVLVLIAIAQDRRMGWIAAGLALTFSANIVNELGLPIRWLGLVFWPRTTITPVALLNCALLVECTVIVVGLSPPLWLLRINRIAAGLALLIFIFALEVENGVYHQTEVWMETHIGAGEQIAYENYSQEVIAQTAEISPGDSWKWYAARDFVEERSVAAWFAAGVHYLVINDRSIPRAQFSQFSRRVQYLTNQGATLLYQTDNPLGIGAHQAVLSTFPAR